MSKPVPERVDVLRCADQGQLLEGRYALAELPRLRPLLAREDGEVRFHLRCGRDAEKRVVLAGEVTARLWLTCQRCLEPVALDVAADVRLAGVTGLQESGLLPEEYEPLLMEDPLLSVRELVEDELLLAVPQVPRHKQPCRPALPPEASDRADDGPFAALAGLRVKHENH
ncbi:MAG: YceD family protein [Pseudomonadota bacterium]